MHGQHCGAMGTVLRKLDGEVVGADEPTPGVIAHPNKLEYVGVYGGERVPTPYCVDASGGPTLEGCPNAATGTRVLHEVRPVRGPARPLAGEPVDAVVYTASAHHRAVRGTDGQCYREYRSGDEWRRSGAYGETAEACRRAAWNAYDRNRHAPMRLIHEAPPDGDPPDNSDSGG